MLHFENKSEKEEFEAIFSYLHRIYKLLMVARFKKMGQKYATQEGRDWCTQMAQDNPDLAELMESITPSSTEDEEKTFIEIANSIIKDAEETFFDRIKAHIEPNVGTDDD